MEYACLKTQSVVFAWRFPLAFQVVILLIILLAAPFYPETPRHLAQTGCLEDARKVLVRCRLRATPESIDQELEEIKDAIRIEATAATHGFLSMIWKKDKLHTRRRVALAMGVQFMEKFSGPDVVAAFGPQIFALSGCKCTLLVNVMFVALIERFCRLGQLASPPCGPEFHPLHDLRGCGFVYYRTLWTKKADAWGSIHDGLFAHHSWRSGAQGLPTC